MLRHAIPQLDYKTINNVPKQIMSPKLGGKRETEWFSIKFPISTLLHARYSVKVKKNNFNCVKYVYLFKLCNFQPRASRKASISQGVPSGWRRDCVRWGFLLSEIHALTGFNVTLNNTSLQLLVTHKVFTIFNICN